MPRVCKAGALHRANGGILVLRAEAVVDEKDAWTQLKGALRDREIRIDEPHRQGNVPMAQAPKPKPVPLDVKVVIVGAPHWYYNVFASDPDFPVHFKVKADIDSEMEATTTNLVTYTELVRDAAQRLDVATCTDEAIAYVLAQSARWADHREKLSGRFELIDDLLAEAAAIMRRDGDKRLTDDHVRRAVVERRRRNSLVEDRHQDSIRRGSIIIDVTGTAIGQVNALTVRDLGDHPFGVPSLITARTSVGKLGVVNIERATLMGGPIQHKGVMELEGFLSGQFARRFPYPSPPRSRSSRIMAASRVTAHRWRSFAPSSPISRTCRSARRSRSPARSTRWARSRRSAVSIRRSRGSSAPASSTAS